MSMQIFTWRDYRAREYLVNTYNVEKGYSFPLHSHQNHWEFVYCEEGEFEHFINGETFRQKEGQMMFVRESDSHSLRGKNFKYHNIAFSGAWITALQKFLGSDLLEKSVLTVSDPPVIPVPAEERTGLHRRLRSLLDNDRGPTQILEFSHFLLYIFDSFLTGREGDPVPEDIPRWLYDLLLYINRKDGTIPGLDEIIDRSCKCAEHVSRSFRKYLNKTPSRYLTELRLKKAEELLRNTNFSVKEICYLSSYENANYFHKQFRQLYGQTPSEYRNMHSRIIH